MEKADKARYKIEKTYSSGAMISP